MIIARRCARHLVPTQCPVCGEEPHVTRLHCDGCGTALESVFGLGPWQRLSRDHLNFAEIFIKRRGKIRDVEDELGVSYPTVVARLNELLAALGFDSSGAPPPEEPGNGRGPQRQQILDELAAGTISAADAA